MKRSWIGFVLLLVLLAGGLHCPPSLKVGLKRLTLSWLLSI